MDPSKKLGPGVWRKINVALAAFTCVQFVVLFNLNRLPKKQEIALAPAEPTSSVPMPAVPRLPDSASTDLDLSAAPPYKKAVMKERRGVHKIVKPAQKTFRKKSSTQSWRRPSLYSPAAKAKTPAPAPVDRHRSFTLSRQNSMSALDRAAARATSESDRQNSQRRQARRDASALSSAHVSGVFEEE